MSIPDLPAWFAARGVECAHAPALREILTFEPPIRIFGTCDIGQAIIGAYSYLAPKTALNLATIGRYCSIGDRCTIGPTQHPAGWLTTSPISYKTVFSGTSLPPGAPEHEEIRPVVIGNDVWIGSDCAIMGGVTIGDGAIVGYGSVVTKDVPPFAIVGGTPARIIRMRFPDETIERIRASPWWRYDLVRMSGGSIAWSDPVAALDEIEERVGKGDIAPIGKTMHRIVRSNGTSFSFTKLR